MKYTFILLIFFLASCSNNGSEYTDVEETPGLPAPTPIIFSVDTLYPHDNKAFTQGLEFYNGKLYEGTGEPNQSTLRIVDIKSGVPEKTHLIEDPAIFGEGITLFNGKIYQLTWQNKKIFVYDINNINQPVLTLNWPYQGWGITNDGSNLIISDGSDKLFYVLPDEGRKEMRIMKILSAADNRGIVDSLNELEYIKGYVYANRWYTNEIVKIDTANGHVVGKMDLANLLKQYSPKDVVGEGDVLNGIAYDSSEKRLYITGKNWPKMFKIKLN